VSEQNAEQTSGESGSLSVGPAVPTATGAQSEPVTVAVPESIEPIKEASGVGSPDRVPEQAAAATSKLEEPKPEAPKAEAPRIPGKVMIMSSGDRLSDGKSAGPEAEAGQSQRMFGKRRISAMAAMVALAAVAGSLGGALATAGLAHFAGTDAASAGNAALQASLARIDSDMLTLKARVEHTSKIGMSQFNKTSDRLDKVERAQAEPAAKLAKLSEAIDKLRAASPAAAAPVAAAPAPVAATPAPVAAREVTASITPAAAAAPADTPKIEVARLPTVEGWVLRGVANGVALIEGRRGIYEVYAGDAVPGAGRVEAIRRQDGRWVVVTSKGLIVGR
jgi:hypothetical protein